jgi:integrase
MTDIESNIDEQVLNQLQAALDNDLEPLDPENGIDRFLDRKQHNVTSTTIEEYRNKLSRFESFCKERDINDLRELNSRAVDAYVSWLRHHSSDEVNELSAKTMRDELYLLRQVIEYFECIDAVESGLSDAIQIPELTDEEGIRDIDVNPERVTAILNHLEKYRYASLEHVVWLVTSRVARRLGGFIALDIPDVHLNGPNSYLEFRHRPPTRLKNGIDGEEEVAITQDVAKVVGDYIEQTRPDVTDEEGREPLLATEHGRISHSTFRRYIYKWSRPCIVKGECPHDFDPDQCEAMESTDDASKCPSSRSPHALRHGYISEARRRGVPLEVLTERVDVSPEVLKEVYDESTPEERREARRDVLDEFTSDKGGGYL